jgi:hypothetical protein
VPIIANENTLSVATVNCLGELVEQRSSGPGLCACLCTLRSADSALLVPAYSSFQTVVSSSECQAKGKGENARRLLQAREDEDIQIHHREPQHATLPQYLDDKITVTWIQKLIPSPSMTSAACI